MKLSSTRSMVSCGVIGLSLLLSMGLASAGAVESDKAAGVTEVEIGVRSSVDERWQGVHKRGPIQHGKVYLIASLNQAPSPKKLTKTVDEAGLLAQLRLQLRSRGFRESTGQEVPDVVLTLLYGRGYLRNPYLANIDGDVSSGSIVPTPAESQLAAAIDPRLYDKRGWGLYEHKLLAAQKEKLFIRVTAWKFPADRQEKPAELWKTTMVVDDPDGNDLNALYPKMLAAGVAFFDRTIKQEEVTISTPLKEAEVKLGPLIILETDPASKGTDSKRRDER